MGGRSSRAQFQYALQSTDLDQLNYFSTLLRDQLRKNKSLRDVNSDQQTGGLQANVLIDRDAASRLGNLPGSHRQHTLRRLRTTPGFNSVQALQPTSMRELRAGSESSCSAWPILLAPSRGDVCILSITRPPEGCRARQSRARRTEADTGAARSAGRFRTSSGRLQPATFCCLLPENQCG